MRVSATIDRVFAITARRRPQPRAIGGTVRRGGSGMCQVWSPGAADVPVIANVDSIRPDYQHHHHQRQQQQQGYISGNDDNS